MMCKVVAIIGRSSRYNHGDNNIVAFKEKKMGRNVTEVVVVDLG